ncbi:MAG: hypothetical protein HQK53_08695 [Oligoflexia bacterium]|nr:hypothetical protein [Oligoflexia bacterium]
MFKRCFLYLWEECRPLSALCYTILISLGILLSLETRHGISIEYSADHPFLVIGPGVLVAAVTVLFLLVIYRAVYVLNDYGQDQIFYPQKPLVSGKIYRQDLIYLICSCGAGVIVVNLLWFFFSWSLLRHKFYTFPIIFLIVCFLFAFLLFRYWQHPKLANVRKNIFLTFAVRALGDIFLGYYLVAFHLVAYRSFLALYSGEKIVIKLVTILNMEHLYLILLWILPAWAYRFSRGIVPPEDERLRVPTFSLLLGRQLVALVPILLLGVQLLMIFRLGGVLNLAPISVLAAIGFLALTTMFFIRYIYRPFRKIIRLLPYVVIFHFLMIAVILFADYYLNVRHVAWKNI